MRLEKVNVGDPQALFPQKRRTDASRALMPTRARDWRRDAPSHHRSASEQNTRVGRRSSGDMEGQGDGRHNGPNCYRIPLPIGNGARNMETLGLRVFILNQEIIFSIHAMIRPPDDEEDAPREDEEDEEGGGNTEDNDEDENVEDDNEDNIEEDDGDDREENMEDNMEDEDETEESEGDADVEDNDGDMEDNPHAAHPDYHADNGPPNDVQLNDDNAVLLFRIRVRPLQHGDVFDDIFLELRLVNNDDFDEIDNNEEHNADANAENIDDDDDDDGFENNNSDDDQDPSRRDDDDLAADDLAADVALEDGDCRDDEGFEDIERDCPNLRDRAAAVVGSVADEARKDPPGPEVSDDPLPGPSTERSAVRDPDDDDDDADGGGGKQFQWWDESNSDAFSDNSGEEEDRPLRRGASDDADSQDDRGGGKKTRKKNFRSTSEDEDFARDADLDREWSRKRRRGEGGAPSETGSDHKRFRLGDASDSDPDDARRTAAPPSDGSRDGRDGRRDLAPSPSGGPAGTIRNR